MCDVEVFKRTWGGKCNSNNHATIKPPSQKLLYHLEGKRIRTIKSPGGCDKGSLQLDTRVTT